METNNKTMAFKTTINCSGCVASVTPFLNNLEGIERWEVATDNPDKVLKVTGSATEEQIIETVKKAGYKIEQINI